MSLKPQYYPLEVAFAGPATGDPPRRARRWQDLTETRGLTNHIMVCDLPADSQIQLEDFRCGAPTLVTMPRPKFIFPLSDPRVKFYDMRLRKPVMDILMMFDVQVRHIEFVQVESIAVAPGFRTDIVLVHAQVTRDPEENMSEIESWINACYNIRKMLLESNAAGINVEIVDDVALDRKETWKITHREGYRDLQRGWPELAPRLLRALGDEGWLELIGAVGYNTRKRKYDPIIAVVVPYDTPHDWLNVREALVKILDAHRRKDVVVKIIRAAPSNSQTAASPDTPLS